MPFIVGIDEAGYGPKIGPLTMASVAFAVPSIKINLWNSLKEVAHKENIPSRKIRVLDSKKLFSQTRGVSYLEHTVLPFISLLNKSKNKVEKFSLNEYLCLLNAQNCEDLTCYPWYCGVDSETVFQTFAQQSEIARNLENCLHKKNLRFCGAHLEFADTARFNHSLTACNKSDFLFDLFTALVNKVLSGINDNEQVVFYVGKHGGKNFYRKDIEEHFNPVSVVTLRESKERSSYKVCAGRRSFTVHFLKDGEDRQFTIALASIFAKYTREIFMGFFNKFWLNKMPDLMPTAGYPGDARRFIYDIYPEIVQMQIPMNMLWRIR